MKIFIAGSEFFVLEEDCDAAVARVLRRLADAVDEPGPG